MFTPKTALSAFILSLAAALAAGCSSPFADCGAAAAVRDCRVCVSDRPMERADRTGSGEAPKLSGVDYSDKNHWLRFGGDGDKGVDIFAVYPTVAFSPEAEDTPFVRIDNGLMRESAEGWLTRVGGIIADSGNVYAPLYGQLNGAMLPKLDAAGFVSHTYASPRDDVFAAFDYYLTHVNKGDRPFILFGHSQGAALAAELATVFLGHEKYRRHNANHVATYAVGYSVTGRRIAENPELRFSRTKDDVGVVVSWNTTVPGEIASGAYKNFGTWNPEALVTNPITWTSDETPAPADANAASLLPQPDGSLKKVERYADARVDMAHRVLVAAAVPEADYSSQFPNIGKFHQHDMGFYHDSIARNIKDRIAAFMAGKSGDGSASGDGVERAVRRRAILEPGIMAYAATRVAEGDLGQLHGIMAEMRASIDTGDIPAFVEGDARFHLAIARLAGDWAAAEMKRLLQASEPARKLVVERSLGEEDAERRLTPFLKVAEQHEKIIAALSGRDPEDARRACEEHLGIIDLEAARERIP